MTKKQLSKIFFFPIRLMIVVPLFLMLTLMFLITFLIIKDASKDYGHAVESLRIFLISGKDQYS